MLIKLEILEAIKAGEIDLQFRRWKRATVKPGGTLKTRVGVMQIGEITPLSVDQVELRDVKRAGFANLEDFRRWLDTMKPGDLCKIEISYLGEDPRVALRNNPNLGSTEMAEVQSKLDQMDARSDGGPWTSAYLQKIADNPARLAEELAHELGMEKHPFKARVRRLKEMGLTESLEVGYRLSPRGKTVLAARKS